MELINKRAKNYGERYQEIHKGILQIDADIKKDAKESRKSKKGTDLEKYFVQLKYLGEFIKQMYLENDYEASMHCCKYLMPRIEKFISYIVQLMEDSQSKNSKDKKIFEWAEKQDELTEYIKRGQKNRCGRFQYIFDYMYWEYMKIAARYSLHWLINYMERDKLQKAYPSRERILKSYVHYMNSMLLNRINLKWQDEEVVPKLIIFSTMPSSGKSFVNNVANLFIAVLGALHLGIGGILRVGNELGNITRQSRQTMNMLEDPLLRDVYPELNQLVRNNGKFDPYSKSSEEEWGIRDVRVEPTTCVFKTRDSAINSVRCFLLAIMDDPSRGQEESNNINIQQDITRKFYGDFQDRFSSQDDMAIALTGTMYSPNDVFSIAINKAFEKGCYLDPNMPNTYITNDKRVVIILNDCEDENGNSAYPEFISTTALMDKKHNMTPYEYACVWRQKPIPPEGLIFAYSLLKQYDELPRAEDGSSMLTDYSFAYIDPTRQSNRDFLSMVILRKHLTTGEFYLVDVIFARKSTKDCYSEIVRKIRDNKIIDFTIECNISEDLDTVLKDRCKMENINYCNIRTIYNTVKKQQRIADLAGTVKNNIVFPKSGKFSPQSTQMGDFMNWLVQYSHVDATNHDDAPDSICGFAKSYVIESPSKSNIIKSYKNLPF